MGGDKCDTGVEGLFSDAIARTPGAKARTHTRTRIKTVMTGTE